MASSVVARVAAVGTFVLAFVAVAACDDRYGRYGSSHRDCDYTYRQCRTYCDYWCDAWGCYPTCYDRCWTECGSDGRRDRDNDDYDYPPVSSSGYAVDASAPPPIAESDAGVPELEPSPGTGVLCTSCSANSDCESGALCILRGGPPRDAGASDGGAPPGRGFCGHACTTSADCPDGFLCSQLGASRQCLPTAGNCQ